MVKIKTLLSMCRNLVKEVLVRVENKHLIIFVINFCFDIGAKHDVSYK